MKKTLSLFLFAALILNISAQSPLKNQVDSVSYLIGVTIANNVLRDLSEANKEMVMQGLGDGLYENPLYVVKIIADKNEIIVGAREHLVKTKINLKDLNIITNDQNDFKNELFVKVRSTGRLIKAKIDINDTNANVNLLEEEHGIAPGQACVFYSKNNNGYKVLGGGWIKS